MTTGEFTAEDWIERLAGALAELAETQKRYPDELDQQHPRIHLGRVLAPVDVERHPDHAAASSSACHTASGV